MNPEFVTALVAVQSALPALAETGENPHFNSKFAPLNEVNPAALKVLTANGFAWVTLPISTDSGPALEYRLLHTCGDEITGRMPLLGAGNPQQLGSAITYARRYSIQAVLGLVTGEDDDGHQASQAPAKRATRQNARQTRDAGKDWETPKFDEALWLNSVQGATTQEALGGLWKLFAAASWELNPARAEELRDFWKERAAEVTS